MSYSRSDPVDGSSEDLNDRLWGDDGSQVDDARSWSSQKSDGYEGAMSDGAHNPHMRSTGSVGSQESGGGGLFHPRFAHNAAHMVNGETRFPTAMSYISDAQHSDVATVCSGSVMEDIEVESLISQEDNPPHSLGGKPAALERGVRRTTSGSSRDMDFGDAVTHSDPTSSNNVVPAQRFGATSPSGHSDEYQMTAPARSMGPPLSRALLMQGAERSSSVKSFGSNPGSEGGQAFSDDGNSLEAEAHSIHSQDTPLQVERQYRDNSSQAGSVKSYGSHPDGSDTGAPVDTDECGGFFDVDTQSVGTRSNYSQDEAPGGIGEHRVDPELNPLYNSDPAENGRRSPGGTIYKGRGTRRYQGRYMHLPLKRFHHNGVHLDVVDEHSAVLYNEARNGLYSDEHTTGFRPESGNDPRLEPRPSRNGFRTQRRSRSRSRSRSPEDEGRRSIRENGGSCRDGVRPYEMRGTNTSYPYERRDR